MILTKEVGSMIPEVDVRYILVIISLCLVACSKQEHPSESNSLCFIQDSLCKKNSHQNQITFSMTPTHAPSEEWITFDVKFSQPIDGIEGRIEGRDMFMGVIPVTWKKLSSTHYQAKVLYGACDSGAMIWRLSLVWNQHQTTFFDFRSDTNKS